LADTVSEPEASLTTTTTATVRTARPTTIQALGGDNLVGMNTTSVTTRSTGIRGRAGLASGLTRGDLQRLGFFVCDADLEDELIRALGGAAVERVIEEQGELASLRILQSEPAHRARSQVQQLHRFLGTRSGRKIQYARLLVEALTRTDVPPPLEGLLAAI
jgi:hypothetical protein